MAETEGWIEDLAGAILDGASIDWASAESSAHLADRPLLDQLRFLATVADLHRRPRSKGTDRVTPQETVESAPAIVDGKYLIEAPLGHGGMGFVYRARHLELGKTFAVKLVHKSHRPEYLARFRIEAHALGRLNHPNIVQVTDFGVDSKAGPYLVMEYIDGITLSAYLKQKGALSLDEALPIFTGISRALDYAHDSGILHRDLKPANVLLFPHEPSHHDVKILDFGIARFLDNPDPLESISEAGTSSEPPSRGLTNPGRILGTLEYIAPEILKGEQASSSVDIYGFGILIYEVLAGKRPFGGSVQELLSGHLHQEPPLPSVVCPSLPKELDDAILRPLNRDPGSRPSRAREVVATLREASYAATVRQWRQSELPKPRQRGSRG